jgi:hypothetical protein
MERDFRRREDEEMRMDASRTGGRYRIFGVDRRRQVAAFEVRGAPRIDDLSPLGLAKLVNYVSS